MIHISRIHMMKPRKSYEYKIKYESYEAAVILTNTDNTEKSQSTTSWWLIWVAYSPANQFPFSRAISSPYQKELHR